MRTYECLMKSITDSENAIRNGGRYSLSAAGYWLAKWETAVISNGETDTALQSINQWLVNHGEYPTEDFCTAILQVTFVLTDIYKEVQS